MPGPTTFVLSETCGPLNVAVTVVFAFNVTRHSVVGVPGKQALVGAQPTNCAPALGLAVRMIEEPGANDVPVGDWVIVPGPTTTVESVTFVAKFAVAVVLAFNTMVQVGTLPIPTQMPFQLMNDELAFGVAFTVTVVLLASDVPVGVCATVPGPLMTVVNENFVTVVTALPLTVAWTIPPPGAFDAILSKAARFPSARGVKVTLMVQDDPTGRLDGQLFV